MVGGKVQAVKRRGAGRVQHLLHAALAKDVNLAGAKLALARANGEERLDGIVGEAAAIGREPLAGPFDRSGFHGGAGSLPSIPDLRVDAIAGLVVGREELGPDAGRQVILDACLLSSQVARHDAVSSEDAESKFPPSSDAVAQLNYLVGQHCRAARCLCPPAAKLPWQCPLMLGHNNGTHITSRKCHVY